MTQYVAIYIRVFILLFFAIFTGKGEPFSCIYFHPQREDTGKEGQFSCINFHPQREDTDSLRLYLLINMICIDLFREILSHFVSTTKLPYGWLKDEYWNHASELNWFYTLLRDMCNISPHKNGWGNPPESKDNCVSACIKRIKIKSDEITDGVSNAIFKENLKNFRSDIVEIERQVLDGHLYEKRIDDLISTDTNFVKVLASRLRPIIYNESGKNVSNNQYALRACIQYLLCLLI